MTDRISAILEALAECLCRQIKDTDGPDVCFCGVIPGEAAVADYAGNCNMACGMAWVRLMSAYPADGVNIPNEKPGNCSSGLGLQIEMGMLRCIASGDSQGNPPSQAELLRASLQTSADALLMRKAVFCCDAVPTKDFILGNYTPTGPLGGLVGGTWGLAVAI